MSRELADHLQYYAEIGVTGISRDPKWRTRTAAVALTPLISTAADSLDVIKTDIGDDCRRCKLCTLGRSQIEVATTSNSLLIGRRANPFVH